MQYIQQELKKIAMFTDIHWGARGNDETHNLDNLEFIDWFISKLPADISHIGFLGDWFESRSAINISTLNYSVQGMRKLNALGIPIIFVTGNHDLYRRTTRDVHSLEVFDEFENVKLIDKPTVFQSAARNVMVTPYLFDHEYHNLALETINEKCSVCLGHFEFKGFVLTGYSTVLEHGPDHLAFKHLTRLFSGHFHKRQFLDNVVYIGNPFGTNHGDAGDFNRGACVYTFETDKVEFYEWADAPSYYKVNLSTVLEKGFPGKPKMKVKCIIDTDISYTDAQDLREAMIGEFQLRDFILEEDRATKQGLLEGETSKVIEVHEEEFNSIDELVIKQLELALKDKTMDGKYDSDLMVKIYKSITIDELIKDTK
jgi:DNA repair exonuclease SbcCD nuclease subunit